LENRKLIASRDVHFFEDNSPSDLAIVDIGTKITPLTGINDLVDNAIAKDKGFSTILSHHELTSDVSEFIPMSTDPAQPTTPVNNTNDNDPPIPPPVPRKALNGRTYLSETPQVELENLLNNMPLQPLATTLQLVAVQILPS